MNVIRMSFMATLTSNPANDAKYAELSISVTVKVTINEQNK